jgi:hypothetical protein
LCCTRMDTAAWVSNFWTLDILLMQLRSESADSTVPNTIDNYIISVLVGERELHIPNCFFFPMPPHIRTDFMVPPPGCGRSVTDF